MTQRLTPTRLVTALILGIAVLGAAAIRGPMDELTRERNAVLRQEASKFDAVSFAALATWSTSDKTIQHGKHTFTRRLAISDTSPTQFVVKIVVSPVGQPERTDSVVLARTIADAR